MTKKADIENALDGLFSSNTNEEQVETITPKKVAPELSEKETIEKKTIIVRKQNAKRGRPKKWEDGVRADGYERTSFIVNSKKMAKAREIALREALTQKELIEYALDLIINNYESIHGEIIPRDSKEKRDVSRIFYRTTIKKI